MRPLRSTKTARSHPESTAHTTSVIVTAMSEP